MPLSSLSGKLLEDEQITLIVADQHCGLFSSDLSRMLGYHPDRLEPRFFPDQVDEILREHSEGRNYKGSGLYVKWSKDWVACTGQERVEQKRMLEERMAIVERCLQESERREIEAGKLRRSSAKTSRERRKQRAEYVRKKKVMEAMTLDLNLHDDVEIYERTVLNSDQTAAKNETTDRKNRLLDIVGKTALFRRTKYGLGATQWKATIDDSTSEVTTLCEKGEDYKATD